MKTFRLFRIVCVALFIAPCLGLTIELHERLHLSSLALRRASSVSHKELQVWYEHNQTQGGGLSTVFEGKNISLTAHENSFFTGILIANDSLVYFEAKGRVQHKAGKIYQFIPRRRSISFERGLESESDDISISKVSIGNCKTKDPNVTSTRDVLNGRGSRFLQAIEPWDNCYSGEETPRHLDIGITVDCSFYKHNQFRVDLVLNAIESYVSRTNLVFSQQFNIYLRVKQVVVLACSGDDADIPFNLCKESIEDDLSLFADWVSDLDFEQADQPLQIAKQGLWHLLTACHDSPGNIGIAYVQDPDDQSRYGTVCEHSVRGSLNVAVTSVTSGTPWLTFAHEVAHNLGARHSFEDGKGNTGGIMDTGSSGLYNGVVQFNPYRKDEICHELDYSINSGICSYTKENSRHSFYVPFDDGCLDSHSTASCGSNGERCENGLCVLTEYTVRLNQVSLATTPLNSKVLTQPLETSISLLFRPSTCQQTDILPSGGALLFNLSQGCSGEDLCDIAKSVGAVLVLASHMECSTNAIQGSQETFVNTCEMPVLHIDSSTGCNVLTLLENDETANIQIVVSSSASIIGEFTSFSSEASELEGVKFTVVIAALIITCFIAFAGLIVYGTKLKQTRESSLQIRSIF